MKLPRIGVLLALLLVVTAAIFSSSLLAGYVWDDKSLIPDNLRLRDDEAWRHALTDKFWDTEPPMPEYPTYWRPVVKLSHVALWRLGDGDPFPFHVANLLLHLACVALAFAWLRTRLRLKGVDAHAAGLGALAGAALFALHTTRFESVPWISDSTDLWMTLFMLAAAVVVRTRAWGLAAVLAALATFSKETSIVLPVVMVVDALLDPAQRVPVKRWLVLTVGALAPVAVRLWLGIGLPNPPDNAGLYDRVSRVLGAVGGYHLRLLPLTPTTQPFEISRVQHGVWLVPGWLMAVGAAAIIAWVVAIVFWRKTRLVLADAFWWLLPLGPLLQLKVVPSITFCSDRYQYLPLLGVCALLAAAVPAVLARDAWRRPFGLALGGLFAACALQLFFAVPAWESNDTLMKREFELRPDSAVATTNYATTLEVRNYWRAAVRLRKRAAELPQPPLEHDLSIIEYAAAKAVVLRDADRRELQALSTFIEGVLRTDQPAPNLALPGETWELAYRNHLRENARLTRRGGDLPLLATALRLRLGQLDEALAKARANMSKSTPDRHLLLAQVHATCGEYDEARKEALAMVEAGQGAHPMVALLSTVDDLTLRSPWSHEWATRRRAALLAAIHSFGAARAELAELEPSREVLRAQLTVELLDRNFEGAVTLIDAALAKTPGDPELITRRREVLDIQGVHQRLEREELEDWAPQVLEPDQNRQPSDEF